MNYNSKYNNHFIKCESIEHGREIIKWWQSIGVDTKKYDGSYIGSYYGMYEGAFGFIYDLPKNGRVMDIPKYPRVMQVSNYSDFRDIFLRVVIMEKCRKFIAWSGAATLEEAEEVVDIVCWSYARDIIEEQIVELTIEDISNGKGVGIAPHLIRIKK